MDKKEKKKNKTKGGTRIEEQNELVKSAATHVFHLIKNDYPSNLYFHNFSHTKGVVHAADEIAVGMGVSDEDREVVALAAWFHDTGFIIQPEKHEDKSIEFAETFLKEHNYPEDRKKQVYDLIRSTEMGVKPKGLLQEIMKDADLHHLGTDDQEVLSTLLRLELEEAKNEIYNDLKWYEWDYEFLKSHRYYTEYATNTYQPKKIKNLVKVKGKLRDLTERVNKDVSRKKEKQEDKVLKAAKNSRPDRGIETMFRVTMRNHLSLSQIADNKANIILSINAIIISIILSSLLPDLSSYPNLVIPTITLLCVCIITIIFAILATIPKMNSGEFTRKDIEERKSNLLFFGNFHNMDIKEFQWGFTEMMNDRDFLYGSMTRDFYYLGNALGKKYKYLNICYKVFMAGLTISLMAFVIAFLMG